MVSTRRVQRVKPAAEHLESDYGKKYLLFELRSRDAQRWKRGRRFG